MPSAAEWRVIREPLPRLAGEKIRLAEDGPVSFAAAFARPPAVAALLAAAPFAAFRWEMPALRAGEAAEPFECVLIDAPGLDDGSASPDAFAEHFAASNADIVRFRNFGGDAELIVPRPLSGASAYGHVAAFVRGAPPPQIHACLHLFGEAWFASLGERPLWASTAGFGVPWVHFRLDRRPKYYRWDPYRQPR